MRRALVVDGDGEHRTLTKLTLNVLKIPADVVSTGLQAMEAMLAHDYDLVLVDMALSDMRGPDLVRVLRNSPQHQRVRVLAHSCYVLPGDVERSFEAGCDAFIERPYSPRTLERAIAALFA
ncbi:MAG: response regulator [Sandaracinaceae bacterium]|nr:response regulator [Sandaracinaceae bacterium]